MSDQEETFRCTHFACTLAKRHCLRRQLELYRKPGRAAGGKSFVVTKAAHPHCAGGTCEQGNAIRAEFPGATHQHHDPRTEPRMDIVRAVEERTMAKAKICSSCKKTELGPNNRSGICSPCQTGYRSTKDGHAQPKQVERAPRGKLVKAAGPASMTVAELVELRAAVEAELAGRLGKLDEERAAIRSALGAKQVPEPVRSAG